MDTNPYLYPGALLFVALLAVVMAVYRRRTVGGRLGRVGVVSYMALATCALFAGATLFISRAPLFWSARWDTASRELVLVRMVPLADVRLPKQELVAVTEVSAPERTITGERPALHFVVQTRSGASYWSAPVFRNSDAGTMRLLLATAVGPRLERLVIGHEQPLP